LRARKTPARSSERLARGQPLSKPEGRGRAPGSRVEPGRVSKGTRTELAKRFTDRLVGARGRRRRSEIESNAMALPARVTSRDGIPRGGSAPAARSSEVWSGRRRAEKAQADFVGESAQGCAPSRSASRFEAIEAGEASERSRAFGLTAPPPRRLPHRANGERTRSKEARPWEQAGPEPHSTMHERASPSSSKEARPRREGPRPCPIGQAPKARFDGR
jgi:hypothetical protein